MEKMELVQNDSPERMTYKDSTYEIVSKVAYLIGVPKRIFENEHEPPKLEIFEKLDKDKNARIVRNLCMLRTSIERNYKKINDELSHSLKSIYSMPEYIPADSFNQLTADGIRLSKKHNAQLSSLIVDINRLISDRINNCKGIFPLWINWDYIRELFIMPEGLPEEVQRVPPAPTTKICLFTPIRCISTGGQRIWAISSTATESLSNSSIPGMIRSLRIMAKYQMPAAISRTTSMTSLMRVSK